VLFGAGELVVSRICEAVDEADIDWTVGTDFEAVKGHGVRAKLEGGPLIVGKPDWLADEGIEIVPLEERIAQLERDGNTVIVAARADELVGAIAIADQVKDDAADAIERLTSAGLTPVMITGDNERTARAVAGDVGIEPDAVLGNSFLGSLTGRDEEVVEQERLRGAQRRAPT